MFRHVKLASCSCQHKEATSSNGHRWVCLVHNPSSGGDLQCSCCTDIAGVLMQDGQLEDVLRTTDLTCRPGLQTRRECPRQAGSSSSPSTSAPPSPTARTDLQPSHHMLDRPTTRNTNRSNGSRECRMSMQRCVGGKKWLQKPCCTLSSVIADCPRLPPGRSHGCSTLVAGQICSR